MHTILSGNHIAVKRKIFGCFGRKILFKNASPQRLGITGAGKCLIPAIACPHRTGRIRGTTNKPAIHIFIRCTGFTNNVPSVNIDCFCSSFCYNCTQQTIHDRCGNRTNCLNRGSFCIIDNDISTVIDDLIKRIRLIILSSIAKYLKGSCHIQYSHTVRLTTKSHTA